MIRIAEITERFGLDNLQLVARPDPKPGPRQVRVRVRAVSLNYRDLLLVRGIYNPKQPLPAVPCSDAAGEVEAVGDGVRRFAVGDRVTTTFFPHWSGGEPSSETLATAPGGPGGNGYLAEAIVVDEDGLVPTPDTLTDAEASTLPCAGLTAWSAIVRLGQVRPGDVVLIEGTGGVAVFALQFAKMAGATVIITSSSDDKLSRARSLGADFGINYRSTPDWGQAARAWAGRQMDHIVELGGAETLDQAVRAIRPGGTISMIGVLSGPAPALNMPLVVMRQVRLQGVTVGPHQSMDAMMRAVEAAALRPVIDRRFALGQVRDAFERLGRGEHFGKIVVEM